MPAKRELTMRQIRYTLRLASEGVSARQIARLLGVARSTVQDNLKRAQGAGLVWPLPADLTDAVLEARLFTRSTSQQGARRRAEPVWGEMVRELKRPGVNLMVLWEEYRAVHPEGYGYSRYVAAVVMWRCRIKPGVKAELPGLKRNIIFSMCCDYRASKNAIRDGNAPFGTLVFRSEMSTQASAFAFIFMSTSACKWSCPPVWCRSCG